MNFDDPTIGLPPEEDDEVVEPTAGQLWACRGLNLFGLVSPVSNLGMVQLSNKELRWVGVGAGVVMALFMGYGWLRGDEVGHTIAFVAATVHLILVVLGLLHPKLPEIPFRLWIKFGELLGKVMSVPMFSILYFFAVTPTALVLRLLGKNPLHLNAPPAESYWVEREPLKREQYERQF